MERLTTELSEKALALKMGLESSVIGQPRAVRHTVHALERVWSGLTHPDHPPAILMFLGPTGVGKTELARALAGELLGSKSALTRIDCAEFQHRHEVAKLIGSPPGYLGFTEKDTARLSQKKLDQFQAPGHAINILLIDEIEKAADDFFDMMLGIFDSATVTLGSGETTDFSKTIILITSNLSSKETQQKIHNSGIGFYSAKADRDELDKDIWRTTKEAVRKFFRPEFINRIDKFISFHSLDETSLRRILNINLNDIQHRLLTAGHNIILFVTAEAKDYFIQQGTSEAFGARELKRVLEAQLVTPLSSIIASGRATDGDLIEIGFDDKLIFSRKEGFKPELKTMVKGG
jgi:ATP-dependent Clp protease ATP-binding subunit ClpB